MTTSSFRLCEPATSPALASIPLALPDLRRLLLWLPRRPSEGGARAAAAAAARVRRRRRRRLQEGMGVGNGTRKRGESTGEKGEGRRALLGSGLLSFVALRRASRCAALLPVLMC